MNGSGQTHLNFFLEMLVVDDEIQHNDMPPAIAHHDLQQMRKECVPKLIKHHACVVKYTRKAVELDEYARLDREAQESGLSEAQKARRRLRAQNTINREVYNHCNIYRQNSVDCIAHIAPCTLQLIEYDEAAARAAAAAQNAPMSRKTGVSSYLGTQAANDNIVAVNRARDNIEKCVKYCVDILRLEYANGEF